MKLTPKKESELSHGFELLPDGDYPFTVLQSDEIASKSAKNKGKMMFALKLNVHGPKYDSIIFDYFADWFSDWKLRHFAATTGQLAAYEAGDLDGSLGKFNGKVGYVKITTEPPRGGYAAKNVVKDYVVREAAQATQEQPPEEDSEVPF